MVDEFLLTFSCSFNKGTCLIDIGYFCNKTIDCNNIEPCDVGCPDDFKCQDGDCRRRSEICNGYDVCDRDDGWKTGIGFQCIRKGKFCRLPQPLLWDQIQDCDQGEDLCYVNNNSSTEEMIFSWLVHFNLIIKLI